MREFKRITIDANVKHGLPCIRDTGITVSEVVKRVVHEKSSQETLVDYPNLEDEDIEEALAYSVKDLADNIVLWRSETQVPLTNIKGYSEMLVKNLGTPEEKAILKDGIAKNAKTALDFNLMPSLYARATYGEQPIYYEAFKASQFIDEVVGSLKSTSAIKATVSDSNLILRADRQLIWAVHLLVNDWPFSGLRASGSVEISIVNEQEIGINIFREFENDESDSQKLERLFWLHSPFSLAQQIISQHNIVLQIDLLDKGIKFSFSLPISSKDT
jgi:uncharacterized protein (DUF433 family)